MGRARTCSRADMECWKEDITRDSSGDKYYYSEDVVLHGALKTPSDEGTVPL